MKSIYTAGVLLLICCTGLGATPALEFAGVAWVEGNPRFLLRDLTEKKTSPFLAIGTEWNGWTLAAFDSTTDTLMVRRAGRLDEKLALRAAKTASAEPSTPGAETDGPRPLLRFVVIAGSFQAKNGMLVFSPDARLKFKDGVVWSPDGTLVCNEQMTEASGDLQVELAERTFAGNEVKLKLTGGSFSFRGKSFRILDAVKAPVTPGEKKTTP